MLEGKNLLRGIAEPGDPHDCHSQHKTPARLDMVWCGTRHHRDISCSRVGLLHRDPRDGGRGPLSRTDRRDGPGRGKSHDRVYVVHGGRPHRKVSGAERLAGDRRLAAYKAKAKDFVTAFDYRDQFSGKPKRDEQGTRDRPFDLTVDFDKEKIDGVLKALGLKPWLSHRPVLAAFVEMEQGERKFIVTSDGTQSDLQRDALLAAAARRGMNIVLPTAAAWAKANINGPELSKTRSSTLVSLAAGQGGEVALVGRLVWNDQDLGWATQWQIDWPGRPHRWRLRGVTFDEAFRRGIGGAAQG